MTKQTSTYANLIQILHVHSEDFTIQSRVHTTVYGTLTEKL